MPPSTLIVRQWPTFGNSVRLVILTQALHYGPDVVRTLGLATAWCKFQRKVIHLVIQLRRSWSQETSLRLQLASDGHYQSGLAHGKTAANKQ